VFSGHPNAENEDNETLRK